MSRCQRVVPRVAAVPQYTAHFLVLVRLIPRRSVLCHLQPLPHPTVHASYSFASTSVLIDFSAASRPTIRISLDPNRGVSPASRRPEDGSSSPLAIRRVDRLVTRVADVCAVFMHGVAHFLHFLPRFRENRSDYRVLQFLDADGAGAVGVQGVQALSKFSDLTIHMLTLNTHSSWKLRTCPLPCLMSHYLCFLSWRHAIFVIYSFFLSRRVFI